MCVCSSCGAEAAQEGKARAAAPPGAAGDRGEAQDAARGGTESDRGTRTIENY